MKPKVSRGAKRRKGEGGGGGSPPENFEIFASKWCILSAFLCIQYTFLTLKKKKKCISIYVHKTIHFLSKFGELFKNQNGAF